VAPSVATQGATPVRPLRLEEWLTDESRQALALTK